MKKTLALATACVALLAACSTEELPTPTVETSTEETQAPQAESERADEILDEIATVVSDVQESRDVEKAKERLTGPALRAVLAELKLQTIVKDDAVLSQINTKGANSTWGASETFPRVAMAFTQPAEEGGRSQVLTLVQVNGQANYRLWGFANMFSSDTPLTFSKDSETVSDVETEGLVASPREVADQYAKFLEGRDTEISFAEDPLAQSIIERRKVLRESVGETGEVRIPVERQNHGPLAIRTEDGGVVAMASYDYRIKIDRKTPGSTITVGEALAVWMTGDPEQNRYDIKGNLTGRYNVQVAFYIPPEGQPQVIAASQPDLLNVTDDESTNPDNQ